MVSTRRQSHGPPSSTTPGPSTPLAAALSSGTPQHRVTRSISRTPLHAAPVLGHTQHQTADELAIIEAESILGGGPALSEAASVASSRDGTPTRSVRSTRNGRGAGAGRAHGALAVEVELPASRRLKGRVVRGSGNKGGEGDDAGDAEGTEDAEMAGDMREAELGSATTVFATSSDSGASTQGQSTAQVDAMLRMDGEASDVEGSEMGTMGGAADEEIGGKGSRAGVGAGGDDSADDEISTLRADSPPVASPVEPQVAQVNANAEADAGSDESDSASDSNSDSDSDSDADSDDSSDTTTDDSDDDGDEDDDDEEDLDKLLAAAKLSAQRRVTGVSGDATPTLSLDGAGAGAGTAGFGEESVLRLDSVYETKDAPIPRMSIPSAGPSRAFGLSGPARGSVGAGVGANAGPSRSRPTTTAVPAADASTISSDKGKAKGVLPVVPDGLEADTRAYERKMGKREKAAQPKKASTSELWATIPSARADLQPQMRRDYQALALANSLDPKRFMKGGGKGNKIPESFAIGTLVDQPKHLQATTVAREHKYRPGQLVQSVAQDEGVGSYAKRKFGDLQWKKMENGRGKGWKKRTKW